MVIFSFALQRYYFPMKKTNVGYIKMYAKGKFFIKKLEV